MQTTNSTPQDNTPPTGVHPTPPPGDMQQLMALNDATLYEANSRWAQTCNYEGLDAVAGELDYGEAGRPPRSLWTQTVIRRNYRETRNR